METTARLRLTQRVTLCAGALALIALIGAGPAMANPNGDPPKLISVDQAGTLEPGGEYLWQYTIYTGTQPNLSHWVLGVCEDVFNSIEPGSVLLDGSPISTGQFDFANPDPSTGATGINFDKVDNAGKNSVYSFETTEDWSTTTVSAYLKAADGYTTTQVTGPSCSLDCQHHPPVTPEPGGLALLMAGVLPLWGRLRRRL